jgi:hypothetical protein
VRPCGLFIFQYQVGLLRSSPSVAQAIKATTAGRGQHVAHHVAEPHAEALVRDRPMLMLAISREVWRYRCMEGLLYSSVP